MAFSDSKPKFWEFDLASRAGAESATRQGALACFVFCGMGVLGMALLGGMAGYTSPEGIAVMVGAALEVAVGLVAGLRLRAGKGAIWGIAAAMLCGLELIGKVLAVSITGIFIAGAVTILIVQGVRGAFALRKGDFRDDDAGAFY